MSTDELLLLAPIGALLGGALLCLFLEATGTPVGARKKGARTHLVVIAVLASGLSAGQLSVMWGAVADGPRVVAHVMVMDRTAILAGLFVLFVLVCALIASVPTLRAYEEDRGDHYALVLISGAGALCAVQARELLFCAAASLVVVLGAVAAVVVDRRSPRGAEAAVKLVMSTGVGLCLLAFAAALTYGAWGETTFEALAQAVTGGFPLALVALFLVALVVLSWLPAFPGHAPRVDAIHGAPAFASILLAGTGLAVSAVLMVRLVEHFADGAPDIVTEPLAVLAVVGTLVPAIAALDQREIKRVVVYLVCAQGGAILLPVALLAQGAPGARDLVFLCAAGAVAASCGALCALGALERQGEPGDTWEELRAGAALSRFRPHPAVVAWVARGAALDRRLRGAGGRVPHRVEHGDVTLALVAALAPVMCAAPVLRLGLFLFAKTPHRNTPQPRVTPWRVAVLVLTGTAVLVLGIAPGVILDALR